MAHDFISAECCCGFCGRTESELGPDEVLAKGNPISQAITHPYLKSVVGGVLKHAEGVVTHGIVHHESVHVHICSRCVDEYAMMIFGHAIGGATSKGSVSDRASRATPEDIVRHLDRYVIGQDEAKRALAIAVWQHYRRHELMGRTSRNFLLRDVEIEKSNVLLVGPTGVGKTELAMRIAEYLDTPFVVLDATEITEAGYVGQDANSGVRKLLEKSGGDVKKAERGIIFIDEVDKIHKKSTPGTVDVHGEGAQQSFLKMLEGSDVSVALKKGEAEVVVNTRHILFIASGAFPGIKQIVEKRLAGDAGIGFGAKIRGSFTEAECLRAIDVEDLLKFGMIEEFVGRLPVIVSLEPLDQVAIERILTEPKNAFIKQYKKYFSEPPYSVELVFEDEVLREIALHALSRKTGARGLRGVIESKLRNLFFSLPGKKRTMPSLIRVVVTRETIEGGDARWEVSGPSGRREAALLAPPPRKK